MITGPLHEVKFHNSCSIFTFCTVVFLTPKKVDHFTILWGKMQFYNKIPEKIK